jgi:hypothetical protein
MKTNFIELNSITLFFYYKQKIIVYVKNLGGCWVEVLDEYNSKCDRIKGWTYVDITNVKSNINVID